MTKVVLRAAVTNMFPAFCKTEKSRKVLTLQKLTLVRGNFLSYMVFAIGVYQSARKVKSVQR